MNNIKILKNNTSCKKKFLNKYLKNSKSEEFSKKKKLNTGITNARDKVSSNTPISNAKISAMRVILSFFSNIKKIFLKFLYIY